MGGSCQQEGVRPFLADSRTNRNGSFIANELEALAVTQKASSSRSDSAKGSNASGLPRRVIKYSVDGTSDCSLVLERTGHRSSLMNLPPVLILEIFKHLDARELSIVSCVCSLFWRLASDSHGWKDFYCERWGLPVPSVSNDISSVHQGKSWKDLYVARAIRSKAFMGRFLVDMMHGHTAAIRCVRLLSQAKLIFTAGYDSILRVWGLEEGLPLAFSLPFGCTIRAIAVDMELLVVAGTDALVRVWHADPDLSHLFNFSSSVGAGSERVLSGHTGPVTTLGLDASRIYSGSWDMTVKVWDRFSMQCVRTLLHMDWVWALAPRGRKLASTAGSDVYTWDVQTGELLRVRTEIHVGQVYAVECSRSGQFVFTAGEDGAICMFDDRASQKRASDSVVPSIANEAVAYWKPHSEPVYALAFEDPWLVSASGDGSLAMMDVRRLMETGHGNKKLDTRFWHNKRQHASYVVASTDAQPPQRKLTGFHHSLYSVDVGADRVVAVGEEKIVRVWDFSQAFEIERRVQASRSICIEHRLRRKQVASTYKGHGADSCNLVAKRDVGGGLVWQRRGDGSRVSA